MLDSNILSFVQSEEETDGEGETEENAVKLIELLPELQDEIQIYQFKVRVEAHGGGYIDSEVLTMKVGCLPQEHILFSDSSQFLSLIEAYIESPVGETVYSISDFAISDKEEEVEDLQSIVSCKV